MIIKAATKHYILALYFSVGIFFAPLVIYTLTCAIFIAFHLTTKSFFFHKKILYLLSPFILLVPIGLLGSWRWELPDVFRDVWYIMNPMLVMVAGWVFCEKIKADVLLLIRVLIFSGLIYSCIHVTWVLTTLSEVELASIRYQPNVLRTGGLLPAIAMAAMLFVNLDRQVKKQRIKNLFMLLLFVASLFLSLSRSWWLVFIICTVFLLLLRMRNRVLVAVLLFGTLASILLVFSVEDGVYCTNFACKVLLTIREMTPKDYVVIQDLDNYWRGYESFVALRQYENGNMFQIFFGQGMGALVDLKVSIFLGDREFDKIPILHNGYIYALFKFGLFGLLILLIQYAKIFLFGFDDFRHADYTRRTIGAFIMAISLVLIILTFVIAGIFNKIGMTPALFYLGSFVCASSRISVRR